MRVFAIGDIHGCVNALHAVIQSLGLKKTDTVVTLGDYVDRGPNSAGVLDYLLDLRKYCKLISLKGNHEELMLNARTVPQQLEEWLRNGGTQTLASYGDGATLRDVPAEHWLFMEFECRDYYEIPTHFFVHANADPTLPLPQQNKHLLRWKRFEHPKPHVSGKIMVCGHTSTLQPHPRNLGHAICLDTRAYSKHGCLSCLETISGKLTQANEKGQVRTAHIDEYLPPS